MTAAVSVVYIYVSGWLGAYLIPQVIGWGEGVPALSSDRPSYLPAVLVRWDAGYYLHIAEVGYSPQGDERAFFPLYPLVVRSVSAALGLSVLWSGMAISILAYAGIGLLLFAWVRQDYSIDQAWWTTLFFYVSPMAFFYVAFYGEPLLLLGSVASLYLARRGQFAAAGAAIAFAGAARPTAFLLAIPYLVEFWQQRDFSRARWLQFGLGLFLAPLGTLAYLAYLVRIGSAPDLFSAYLGVGVDKWKTYHAWPWMVLVDGLRAALSGAGISGDWFSRAVAWHDLAYALGGLGLGIWSMKRLRLSAALFLLVGMLYLWSVHGPYGYAFWSIPRRVAALAPVYLAVMLLISQLPTRWRWSLFGFSIVSLGLLVAWFASGRWIA